MFKYLQDSTFINFHQSSIYISNAFLAGLGGYTSYGYNFSEDSDDDEEEEGEEDSEESSNSDSEEDEVLQFAHSIFLKKKFGSLERFLLLLLLLFCSFLF